MKIQELILLHHKGPLNQAQNLIYILGQYQTPKKLK